MRNGRNVREPAGERSPKANASSLTKLMNGECFTALIFLCFMERASVIG